MLKDEVLEYVRKQSGGRMMASAPGVREALGVPLTEASAALVHLEAERKIERVDPKLQVFKLVGVATEAGISVKDSDDVNIMKEVVVSQGSVGESVTTVVVNNKTEKEKDIPSVSFDKTKAVLGENLKDEMLCRLRLGDLSGFD